MIKIEKVSLSYDKRTVLEDISITLKEKSFIGIIGKNGTGKSTLLKAITGLLKPVKGNIFVDNEDVYMMKKNILAKKISFMPQTMQFDFSFNVKDFIMFGRFPYINMFKLASKDDFQIVEDIMHFTQTTEFSTRNINELSGGEKQKVLLAQTLVQETDIIALDEPTSHLDIGSQATIFKLLKMLNEKYNKTIITTVHDLNLAGEFCSDIVLLDDKKVLNFGNAEKVLNYKDIEKVYGLNVVVHTNPVSKKPVVIPVYN
jgi:iron complex transport system ATP-binding protein